MVEAPALLDTVPIDRRSPIPYYSQLATLLQRQVMSGRWKPGDRLESEPAICSRYQVSRSTVRQALQTLEDQGLIAREKGRGTFVTASRPSSWRLQSPEGLFYEGVGRLGKQITSKILRAEPEALPAWAVETLRLPNERGVTLERLRSVDGEVAIYVVNHLPPQYADTVTTLDAEASLYDSIERNHGDRVAGGHRSVEAVAADAELAEMLDCQPASPVAFIESVSWDLTHRPFDCYRAWLRTDRLRIEIAAARPRHSDRRDG